MAMDTAHNDLTFNVAQLLKESVGSTRRLEIGTPTLVLTDETIDIENPIRVEAHDVKGNVKITRITQDLLVQGNVSAQVDAVCGRCLDEFRLPVSGTLEEQYEPTVDIETGHSIRRAEDEEVDDTAFEINQNHEIDLTEPVRQALLVAMPISPVCREDCAGLCPNCGANLNDGPHSCQTETVDNRWAALSELKIEDFPIGDGSLN